MIKDPEELRKVQAAWHSVRRFQQMMNTNIASSLFGAGFQSWEFGDASHSLVLIFAYGVLEDCLRVLQAEQVIPAAGPSLQKLLQASREVLPWKNLSGVREGQCLRNRVAHDQFIAPRAESWKYIDLLEAELISWKVLEGPVQATYVLERGKAQ